MSSLSPTPETKPHTKLRVVNLEGLKLAGGKGLPWAVGDETVRLKASPSGLVRVRGHGGWFRPHRFEVIS